MNRQTFKNKIHNYFASQLYPQNYYDWQYFKSENQYEVCSNKLYVNFKNLNNKLAKINGCSEEINLKKDEIVNYKTLFLKFTNSIKED